GMGWPRLRSAGSTRALAERLRRHRRLRRLHCPGEDTGAAGEGGKRGTDRRSGGRAAPVGRASGHTRGTGNSRGRIARKSVMDVARNIELVQASAPEDSGVANAHAGPEVAPSPVVAPNSSVVSDTDTRSGALRSSTVMMVDDDPIMLEVVQTYL